MFLGCWRRARGGGRNELEECALKHTSPKRICSIPSLPGTVPLLPRTRTHSAYLFIKCTPVVQGCCKQCLSGVSDGVNGEHPSTPLAAPCLCRASFKRHIWLLLLLQALLQHLNTEVRPFPSVRCAEKKENVQGALIVPAGYFAGAYKFQQR